MSVWNTGPNSSESPDDCCGDTHSVCSARSNGYCPWVSSTSFCHSRLLELGGEARRADPAREQLGVPAAVDVPGQADLGPVDEIAALGLDRPVAQVDGLDTRIAVDRDDVVAGVGRGRAGPERTRCEPAARRPSMQERAVERLGAPRRGPAVRPCRQLRRPASAGPCGSPAPGRSRARAACPRPGRSRRPSATTVRPRLCARSIVERTIFASSASVSMLRTNDWSIFSSSTGSRFR